MSVFDIAAIVALPIALLGCSIGVAIPMTALSMRMTFTERAVPVLIWGGLRGGIAVVILSIVVQGMTMKTLIGRLVPSLS